MSDAAQMADRIAQLIARDARAVEMGSPSPFWGMEPIPSQAVQGDASKATLTIVVDGDQVEVVVGVLA